MSSLLGRPVPATTALPVEVRVCQAAECLISLQLACLPGLRCAELEIGCQWFDQVRTSAPADVRQELERFHRLKQAGTLWTSLIGLVIDGAADVPQLVLLLEETAPDKLWAQVLGLHSKHEPRPILQAALLEAGAGDPAPLERELRRLDRWSRRWMPDVVRLFDADAEAAKERVVTMIRLWYAHVFRGQWPEIEGVLEKDAAAKRRLARQLSVSELVDRATNGLEYVPEVGIDRLVLLPTYLQRPWFTQVRQGRTLAICYPAGEEASSTEEARLARVVRFARVLADATRAQALRRLATSTLTLQELADDLGVSKSTMHHHLAALRSVGLLRVRPDGRRYSLRREALADLGSLLHTAFTGTPGRTVGRGVRSTPVEPE